MKKVFLLSCLLLSAMLTFAQETKKVAILEVVDKEGKLSYGQKLVLRSNMAKAVTKTAGYEAYDRTDMDAIMSEQNFQRTGMVSNDQIKRLGEMTGVAYILVTEGALTGDGKIFVSTKLLNVETAKMEMTDNQMMGLSSEELQKGCEALAYTLFGNTGTPSTPYREISKTVITPKTNNTKNKEKSNIPQSKGKPKKEKQTIETQEAYDLVRVNSKEYIYKGVTMDKNAYSNFLRQNCPQAYAVHTKGSKFLTGGWSCFGCGLGLIVGGSIMCAIAPGSSLSGGGAAFLTVGSLSLAGSIPLLTLGYMNQKKAIGIFNSQCASSTATPITFNLTTGQSGIGLAINF